MVKSVERRPSKNTGLWYFLPYIRKTRVLLWFWHFSILLFLGILTQICSRNMVKSVEKRPSKKSGLWYSLPYIYIHKKNSSFALNLTLSNSVIEYKFKLDSPDFYVDDNARKLSIFCKNLSHHCFSLLLHPVPMGVGWRAIRAPTDTFLVCCSDTI